MPKGKVKLDMCFCPEPELEDNEVNEFTIYAIPFEFTCRWVVRVGARATVPKHAFNSHARALLPPPAALDGTRRIVQVRVTRGPRQLDQHNPEAQLRLKSSAPTSVFVRHRAVRFALRRGLPVHVSARMMEAC